MSVIESAPGFANRLYCPILFKFAARMAQMSWSEFISDPVDTVAALRNAQAALDADLLVNWFDDWSECELLGVPIVRDSEGNLISHSSTSMPSQPLAMLKSELKCRLAEVAGRLHAERRPGTLLAGFFTGPMTLASRLSPESEAQALELAIQWAVEMIRSYGEIGLDFTIVAEDAPRVEEFYRDHARALAPVANLSRYYRHPLIVLNCARPDEEAAEPAIGGAQGIGTITKVPAELFTVPAQSLTVRMKPILDRASARRTLLLSSWEVPTATEPERVLELARLWKGGGA